MRSNERAATARSPFVSGRARLNGRVIMLAALVALACWAVATTPGFLTIENLRAILASVGFVGLVACGMTLIMINGNIFSLSLGTVLAVSGMVYVTFLEHGLLLAIAAATATGGGLSAIQGWLIGFMRANPIVVTLATAGLLSGIATGLTGGVTLTPPAGVAGYEWLSRNYAGVPFAVFILLASVILAQWWLSRAVMGRTTFLVGSSYSAAVAAGLPVLRSTVTVFGLAGVTAAVAGILLASFNDNANISMGGTYNYDAIAAAVVGGTAVAGGRGSVVKTLGGALFISTVSDLLLLRGHGTGAQILVKGLIVLVFVLVAARERSAP